MAGDLVKALSNLEEQDALKITKERLKAGNDALIARVPPRNAPRPGDSVTVGFVPDRLHFFDAETELALA